MKPLLGIIAAPGPDQLVLPLLQALRKWAEVRYLDEQEYQTAQAFLATTSRAPGLDKALRMSDNPFALWVSAEQPKDFDLLPRRPAIVLSSQRDDEAGSLFIPASTIDTSRIPPITPFVRARWRKRWGLPELMVVHLDGSDQQLPADLLQTAMAVAAAVVARGPELAEALAWQAPCVTDEASAYALGVRDGIEVLIASPDVINEPNEVDETAASLAGDLPLAASISRAGRRFAEDKLDLGRSAAIVAERLGLLASLVPAGGPSARVASRLAELWTPNSARIVDRVLSAMASLEGREVNRL